MQADDHKAVRECLEEIHNLLLLACDLHARVRAHTDNSGAMLIQLRLRDVHAFHRQIADEMAAIANSSDLGTLYPEAGRVIRTIDECLSRQRLTVAAHMESHGRSLPHDDALVRGGALALAVGLLTNTRTSGDILEYVVYHTLLVHLAMRYNMLYSVAAALRDNAVAELGKAHFRELAALVKTINYAIPSLVAADLRRRGVLVDDAAVVAVEQELNGIWRSAR